MGKVAPLRSSVRLIPNVFLAPAGEVKNIRRLNTSTILGFATATPSVKLQKTIRQLQSKQPPSSPDGAGPGSGCANDRDQRLLAVVLCDWRVVETRDSPGSWRRRGELLWECVRRARLRGNTMGIVPHC